MGTISTPAGESPNPAVPGLLCPSLSVPQIRRRKQSLFSAGSAVLISGYGKDSGGAGATLWLDAQALSYSPSQRLPNLSLQHRGHPGQPLSQKEEGSEVNLMVLGLGGLPILPRVTGTNQSLPYVGFAPSATVSKSDTKAIRIDLCGKIMAQLGQFNRHDQMGTYHTRT